MFFIVLYMSSSFWLLQGESCDFSQSEKERTACKAEQIQKIAVVSTENGPRLVFCEFAQPYIRLDLSFSA